MAGQRVKVSKEKTNLERKAGPLGSGYFVLKVFGEILLIFAVGILVFPYSSSILAVLFEGKVCLLWVFVLVVMLIALTLLWFGEKQGRKRIK